MTILTSYPEGSDIANTPHLVKISNDRYLVIWSRSGPLDPTGIEEGDGTIYYQMIDGNGNLIGNLIVSANVKEGVDYKLDLPANIINVGTYSAKVTLMGNYTGSKTLWFKVIPAMPRCSIKAQKRKIKITMKKPASAYGGSQFQIKYRIKGKKWKTITVSSQKKTLKKLKKGKKYNVKVCAFKKVNGKTYYGDWYCKTVKVK